eukprot:42865-Eustigmatos_ZCMA.PRE.1
MVLADNEDCGDLEHQSHHTFLFGDMNYRVQGEDAQAVLRQWCSVGRRGSRLGRERYGGGAGMEEIDGRRRAELYASMNESTYALCMH